MNSDAFGQIRFPENRTVVVSGRLLGIRRCLENFEYFPFPSSAGLCLFTGNVPRHVSLISTGSDHQLSSTNRLTDNDDRIDFGVTWLAGNTLADCCAATLQPNSIGSIVNRPQQSSFFVHQCFGVAAAVVAISARA